MKERKRGEGENSDSASPDGNNLRANIILFYIYVCIIYYIDYIGAADYIILYVFSSTTNNRLGQIVAVSPGDKIVPGRRRRFAL